MKATQSTAGVHSGGQAAPAYALSVGEKGASRLNLVQSVYGEFCTETLKQIGIRPGLRVADIGCGTGTMAAWLADQIGPSGEVVALDESTQQIDVARRETAPRANITFVAASAYDTGLPRNSFDLVHCRLVLVHLTDPLAALREMVAILRPGGTLVCFEADLSTVQSLPPTEAYRRYLAVSLKGGSARGVDLQIGSRLHTLFISAGLLDPDIRFHHPVYMRGEEKRLFEYTFRESAPRRISVGVCTQEEHTEIESLLAAVAMDETIAVSQGRMTACWATKPL